MIDPREICGPIATIYRSHLRYMIMELEDYRIGNREFDFLMTLYHTDGISQEGLAKALYVSKATSTRAIHSPWKKKVMCAGKEMKMIFGLTGFISLKKKKTRYVILEKLISFVDTLLSDFTPEEKETFRN